MFCGSSQQKGLIIGHLHAMNGMALLSICRLDTSAENLIRARICGESPSAKAQNPLDALQGLEVCKLGCSTADVYEPVRG